MPVYELSPQRNWGDSVGDAMKNFLQYYLLTKRAREDKAFRERQFGLEETLAQSQAERNRAMAEHYSGMDSGIAGIDGFTLADLVKRARRNKVESIMSSPGTQFNNPMAVYGSPDIRGQKVRKNRPVAGGGLPGLEGYDKPTISIGSRGQVSGMTFRPQSNYPESYKADSKNAISAIDRGADRYKVYQRIAGQYPELSTELKRILLFSTPEDKAQILSVLFGGE